MRWLFGHSVIMLDVLPLIQQFIIAQFSKFLLIVLRVTHLGKLNASLKRDMSISKSPTP